MDNKTFLKALGQRIDALRKEKGLSFLELSYMSEIEKSNLVKLTSQGTNVTALSLLKISKALQIPLSVILDFDYGLEGN